MRPPTAALVPRSVAGFVLVALLAVGHPASAQPVRLTLDAFGTAAEVEVHDLRRDAAEAAAKAALTEIWELSRLFDAEGDVEGGVGSLNAAAGTGPHPVEPRVADAIRRALLFCLWTGGAHGPLGRELHELWNPPGDALPRPTPGELRMGSVRADCSLVALAQGEDGSPTVDLSEGSQVGLEGFGRGYAVDRAVEVLREHGVENGWVEVGGVRRAFGPGPDDEGWFIRLPRPPGGNASMDELWLEDQALAIVAREPIEGEPPVRWPDQRTGAPPRGVVATVAVAELAIEAEALAVSTFVLGMWEGQMRMGTLDPRPAVLWFLGDGSGPPVEGAVGWSGLRHHPPPRPRR